MWAQGLKRSTWNWKGEVVVVYERSWRGESGGWIWLKAHCIEVQCRMTSKMYFINAHTLFHLSLELTEQLQLYWLQTTRLSLTSVINHPDWKRHSGKRVLFNSKMPSFVHFRDVKARTSTVTSTVKSGEKMHAWIVVHAWASLYTSISRTQTQGTVLPRMGGSSHFS